jgi:DtxR family Mn-dependent transcriptional regulator
VENNAGFYTYRGYELLRQEKLRLSPSMEDYLEMIYRTCKKQGYIRMTSLAQQLNVQASSATKTVQKLAEMKLLAYEKYGIIQLTEEGRKIGEFLLKRHRIVETFLKNIGVKENLLRQTEMIEHHLTADTVRSIDMLNKFFKEYPEIHKQFLQFLIN